MVINWVDLKLKNQFEASLLYRTDLSTQQLWVTKVKFNTIASRATWRPLRFIVELDQKHYEMLLSYFKLLHCTSLALPACITDTHGCHIAYHYRSRTDRHGHPECSYASEALMRNS